MAYSEDKELQIKVHTSGIDIPLSDKDFRDEYNIRFNQSDLWLSDTCKYRSPSQFIDLVVQIIGNPTLLRLQEESKLFLYEGGLRPISSMGGIRTEYFKSVNLSTHIIYFHLRHIL